MEIVNIIKEVSKYQNNPHFNLMTALQKSSHGYPSSSLFHSPSPYSGNTHICTKRRRTNCLCSHDCGQLWAYMAKGTHSERITKMRIKEKRERERERERERDKLIGMN